MQRPNFGGNSELTSAVSERKSRPNVRVLLSSKLSSNTYLPTRISTISLAGFIASSLFLGFSSITHLHVVLSAGTWKETNTQ